MPKNMRSVESPKITLKRLKEPLITSYNLIFSQKSEIRKFKSGSPLGKRLGKFIARKGFSTPTKLDEFSKKLLSITNDISFQSLKNT